jgi:hypothetical protein
MGSDRETGPLPISYSLLPIPNPVQPLEQPGETTWNALYNEWLGDQVQPQASQIVSPLNTRLTASRNLS